LAIYTKDSTGARYNREHAGEGQIGKSEKSKARSELRIKTRSLLSQKRKLRKPKREDDFGVLVLVKFYPNQRSAYLTSCLSGLKRNPPKPHRRASGSLPLWDSSVCALGSKYAGSHQVFLYFVSFGLNPKYVFSQLLAVNGGLNCCLWRRESSSPK
jgi:hypothetical protein